MRVLPILALVAAASAATAVAQQRDAPFAVGNQGFGSLADAVAAIGAGRGTVMIAPGTYHQCAVQQAGDVTFRAATPGTVILDGAICEEKAALVLRGAASHIDGIVFQNMRVPDGNGAGIRLEHGDLTIVNSLFRNSEQGLLTADDPAASVTIDRSTFQHLGRCDRDLACAHSIYIGAYAALRVTNSRFELGDGGHYVKSRTPSVDISNNSFDDSGGTLTNYMIDLPYGATGRIAGNTMVQGKDKDNWSAFIAVAAESRDNPSDGLSISGNTAGFVPGISRASAFVADWAHARIAIGANQLAPSMIKYQTR